MNKNIVIIDYGAGNVRSVINAFEVIGNEVVVTDNINKIKAADYVIFPGVGHAEFAMKQLELKKLDIVIPSLTQPVLGICLGMQLMTSYSEEGDTKCLDILGVNTLEFPRIDLVPHMGWNEINVLNSNGLFKNINNTENFYFVHSYYVPDNHYSIANSMYINTFCSAFQVDNFFGVQFHPEKSGRQGLQLLKNFISL